MLRILAATSLLALSLNALAAPGDTDKTVPAGKVAFSFNNVDILKILALYAKASGKTFVVDPNVKGTATILLPKPVTLDEAFGYLSTALASNSVAIVPEADTLHVMTARQALHWGIETVTELPAGGPERMMTLILTLKHVSANEINKRLRILPSRDGELTPYEPTNQLILTDWITNLRRIVKLIDQLDQPGQVGFKSAADPDKLYDEPSASETAAANKAPKPSPTPAK